MHEKEAMYPNWQEMEPEDRRKVSCWVYMPVCHAMLLECPDPWGTRQVGLQQTGIDTDLVRQSMMNERRRKL